MGGRVTSRFRELISADAFLAELRSDVAPERSGAAWVSLHHGLTPPGHVPLDPSGSSLPFVVVGVASASVDEGWCALCDVVVDEGDPALDDIEANLERHPITAATLALLLRNQAHCGGRRVVAESAAYSVLQSGPEFAAWRDAHPHEPIVMPAHGSAWIGTETCCGSH